VTLIYSKEAAIALGISQTDIITTEAITMTADIAVNAFLLTSFFEFVVLIIVK
jgi:hypothetical protein